MNKLTLAAVLQAFLTVCILWLVYQQSCKDNGGMPYQFELTERTGAVTYVKDHRYEVFFSLYGDPNLYVYSRKSGASDRVYSALKSLQGSEARVLCDMASGYSAAHSQPHRQCFDIRVGGQVIRSYDEVLESCASKGETGRYFAFVMVIWSLVMLILAYRFRRVLKRKS